MTKRHDSKDQVEATPCSREVQHLLQQFPKPCTTIFFLRASFLRLQAMLQLHSSSRCADYDLILVFGSLGLWMCFLIMLKLAVRLVKGWRERSNHVTPVSAFRTNGPRHAALCHVEARQFDLLRQRKSFSKKSKLKWLFLSYVIRVKETNLM